MAAFHAGGPQFIAADGERGAGGEMAVARERDPPGAARRDASPHRGSGTLAASDDGLANAGSDRSVASPRGKPQRADAGCIGFETFLMQNLDKNETFLIQLRCNSRAAVWYNLVRQD